MVINKKKTAIGRMIISKYPATEIFKMDNKTTATTNYSIRSIKPMHFL